MVDFCFVPFLGIYPKGTVVKQAVNLQFLYTSTKSPVTVLEHGSFGVESIQKPKSMKHFSTVPSGNKLYNFYYYFL